MSFINYSKLSEIYQVSKRTLYRWKNAGVDLSSKHSIALHLVTQQSASPLAIAAAIHQLSN